MLHGQKTFALLLRYALAHQIEEWGWEIGAHSYGAEGSPTVIEADYARLKIGNYCSIARDVLIILGNHRTDTLTSYPFKTLRHFWPEATNVPEDHTTKGDIVIGHDVWIGARATLLSGVNIGSGAVIGSAAVVTKDVPPYAIVGGNPARVLKYRFSDQTITGLLKIAWWNWPEKLVRNRLPHLVNQDAEGFLRKFLPKS